MRSRTPRNTPRNLFMIQADLEYEKTRRGYVLKKYDGSQELLSEAYRIVNELPEDYLLFSQGDIKGNWFRRCDGSWIQIQDEATLALVKLMHHYTLRAAYVDSVSGFINVTSRDLGIDTDHAVFAVAQAVSSGLLGEYTPYDFGYSPRYLEEVDYSTEKPNIYCGDLALWEHFPDLQTDAMHICSAHFPRKIIESSAEDESSGITIVELIERRCVEKGIPGGYPPIEMLQELYFLACEIEAGRYRFVNEPPVFFTRVCGGEKKQNGGEKE